MAFAPPRALFVPTGTAAALVVSQVGHADPQLDARRWTHLAVLGLAARVRALETLVTDGVYARIEDRIVVVRVVRDGVRSLAAIVADRNAGSDEAASGTSVEARVTIASSELEHALLAATRTRPIFHGTPPDGSTLSGFIPEDPDAILAAIAAEGASTSAADPREGKDPCTGGAHAGTSVLAVFAGTATALPQGLVVVG